MTSGTLTQALVRTLDRAATALGRDRKRPQHLIRGTRGEEAAYFYLRKFGYVMVARNYRSSRRTDSTPTTRWKRRASRH